MSVSRMGFLARGFWVIPSLVQIAFIEMLGASTFGGGLVARVLDHFGLCGHPPVAPLTWGVLGYGAFGGFFLWLLFRDIWNPGVRRERFSPVRRIGSIQLTLSKDPAGYEYRFLASHPSYVLMDLFAAIAPGLLTYISWGEDPMRHQTMHVFHWWLIVSLSVPVARLFCWYVLGRGPGVIAAMTGQVSAGFRREMEWENFWSGPLAFWIIVLVVMVPVMMLSVMKARQEANDVPALTAEVIKSIYGVHHTPNAPESISPNHDDEQFRVRGRVVSEIKHWPGGGGEKYDGLGFVVALLDGPEVVVFADAVNEKALNKAFAKSEKNGDSFTCLVRTLGDGGKEIQDFNRRSYNWNEVDFGPPPAEAKSFTNTGRRMLTYYVDP